MVKTSRIHKPLNATYPSQPQTHGWEGFFIAVAVKLPARQPCANIPQERHISKDKAPCSVVV